MNDQQNKYDQRGSLEMHEKAMLRFTMAAEAKGYEVTKPINKNQIKYDHINCFIKKIVAGKMQSKSVKVVARKRVDAWDADAQSEWIWIELHGVRHQDPGWLYGTRAGLIAFEQSDHFIIVTRDSMQMLVPELIRWEKKVSKPSLAEYAVYSRPGRQDKLTLIKARDLFKINYKIWRY